VSRYFIEAGNQHDAARGDGKVSHLTPSAEEGQATATQVLDLVELERGKAVACSVSQQVPQGPLRVPVGLPVRCPSVCAAATVGQVEGHPLQEQGL
jgi:hypothetical protein